MDSRSRHLLEVEADAVADSGDVEIAVAGLGEDTLGSGVYVAVPRVRPGV